MVPMDSSAVDFQVKTAFTFHLSIDENFLPMKEGRKPEYLEKNPDYVFQKVTLSLPWTGKKVKKKIEKILGIYFYI